MKKLVIVATALLVLAFVFVSFATWRDSKAKDSVGAIATSTETFIYVNATKDDIVVTSPAPESTIGQKFTILGEARGNWYFEASFPAEIITKEGDSLGIFPIQANGEWMTTDFVPFSYDVDAGNYEGPATIILHRDNPSGLPEYESSVSIPVFIEVEQMEELPDNLSDVEANVTDFESCLSAGMDVIGDTCTSTDGRVFIKQ